MADGPDGVSDVRISTKDDRELPESIDIMGITAEYPPGREVRVAAPRHSPARWKPGVAPGETAGFALNTISIDAMSDDELVRVIRGARFLDRLCPAGESHLEFYDLATLRRLAHLARLCCHHQPN